jgi:hypothetical protein
MDGEAMIEPRILNKNLDNDRKTGIIDPEKPVKVPRGVIIETLKTIKGLERKWQNLLATTE